MTLKPLLTTPKYEFLQRLYSRCSFISSQSMPSINCKQAYAMRVSLKVSNFPTHHVALFISVFTRNARDYRWCCLLRRHPYC